ncbi:MAG: type II secretion system F family protein [Sphingomonadaceae bacterium]
MTASLPALAAASLLVVAAILAGVLLGLGVRHLKRLAALRKRAQRLAGRHVAPLGSAAPEAGARPSGSLARTQVTSTRPRQWLARLLGVPPASVTGDLCLRLAAGAAVALLLGLRLSLPVALAVPGSGLATIVAARLLLQRAAGQTRVRLRALLPDAIALIVRCLRAGVPISEAIAEAGRGTPAPLGPLLADVHRDVRLGRTLEDALWQAARRIGLPEFDFLCVTVSIQRETGGNLAETLSGLESTIRKRMQLQLKVKALSAEARTSALVIGSLPLLMAAALALLLPSYLVPLIETPAGRMLLGAAIASLLTGALVMVHLVRREV